MAKETEPLDLPEDFEPDKNDTQAGLLRLSANQKYSKDLLSIRAYYRARHADRECTNYFVQYPDDADNSATWVGLKDQALEEYFRAQMPIPQAEIDRFKRTIKGE